MFFLDNVCRQSDSFGFDTFQYDKGISLTSLGQGKNVQSHMICKLSGFQNLDTFLVDTQTLQLDRHNDDQLDMFPATLNLFCHTFGPDHTMNTVRSQDNMIIYFALLLKFMSNHFILRTFPVFDFLSHYMSPFHIE